MIKLIKYVCTSVHLHAWTYLAAARLLNLISLRMLHFGLVQSESNSLTLYFIFGEELGFVHICCSVAGSVPLSPTVCVDKADTVCPLWAARCLCVYLSRWPGCVGWVCTWLKSHQSRSSGSLPLCTVCLEWNNTADCAERLCYMSSSWDVMLFFLIYHLVGPDCVRALLRPARGAEAQDELAEGTLLHVLLLAPQSLVTAWVGIWGVYNIW